MVRAAVSVGAVGAGLYAATMLRSRIAGASVVAALAVAGTAAVAVASGPSVPLSAVHGGYAVCLAPPAGVRYRTTISSDGTACTADAATGIYFVRHGVTSPAVVQVTLETPYRGFEAATLGPTDLRVTVGRPDRASVLYRGDLRFWWTVAAK